MYIFLQINNIYVYFFIYNVTDYQKQACDESCLWHEEM